MPKLSKLQREAMVKMEAAERHTSAPGAPVKGATLRSLHDRGLAAPTGGRWRLTAAGKAAIAAP